MIKLYLSVLSVIACVALKAEVVTSVASGNWNSGSTWSTGTVPTGSSQVVINSGHTVLFNAAGSAGTITINAGGTLNAAYAVFEITDSVMNAGTFQISGADTRIHAAATSGLKNTGTVIISAGYLQIGGNGFNDRSFVNSGLFTMSSGTFDMHGNFSNRATAEYIQTGGSINVDGNAHGDVTKSVAAGTNIVEFLNPANKITLSGGDFCLVDPHLFATPGTYTLYFNNTSSTPVTASDNYTFFFNNWAYSIDSGGNTKGFYVYMDGNHTLNLGNLTVVGSAAGANRLVTFEYPPNIHGNMLILNWAEFRQTGVTDTLRLWGNLTVTPGGTLTISNISFESTTNQLVEKFGTIRNAVTGATANFNSLNIAKTAGTSVSFDSDITVSDAISLGKGTINMTGHILTLGVSSTHTGVVGNTQGYIINGKMKRWIAAATGNYSFPVGNTDGRKTASIVFTAPASGGSLTAEWIAAYSGTNGLPLTEGTLVVDSASRAGYWRMVAADGLSPANYNATFTAVSAGGVAGVTSASKLVLLKRSDATAPWTLNGSHITTTGSTDSVVLSRNGMSGFSDFGIGISVQGVLPVTLLSFTAQENAGAGIRLSWKVAQQQNIDRYVIERSNDGRTFTAIATVTANASTESSYSFTDASPYNGNNYYRLRIEEAGRSSYSNTLLLSIGRTRLFVYPSPAKDIITIQRSEAVKTEAVITDLQGKVLVQLQLTNATESVNISRLQPGIYLLKTTNGMVQQFLKQ